MRIAYLVHFYPPTPCGGVGYFTANLVDAFSNKGEDVGVLCVDTWGQGTDYFNGYTDEVYGGALIRRLHVNWRKAPRPFDWLYDSPVLGAQARDFFAHFRPDVVHVNSCYALSTCPVIVAREMGLPIVVQLHDYWTVCARHTLLHRDSFICSGPETTWKCQRCLLMGTKSWKLTGALMNDTAQQRLFEELAQFDWATRLPSLIGMLGDLQQRQRSIAAMIEAADVLITLTDFAREVLMRHGAGHKQIRIIPNGNRLDWVGDFRHVPSEQLRIGFLGNIIPIKGVHILIDAYKALRQEGHIVHLTICGDTEVDADYYHSLRSSSPEDIVWRGKYDQSELPGILANLDVIVVPSLWYEVQPFVVQEAFAAGLPVVVSDGSSLAATVDNGVNGLHFRMGSADDLAVQLKRILDEPQLLRRLQTHVAPPRTIEQNVDEFADLYATLVQQYSVSRQSGSPNARARDYKGLE